MDDRRLRRPALPADRGPTSPGARLLNAYLVKYRAAASVDPVLGRTFLRLANMIDKPTRLLSPGPVPRVFRSAGQATQALPARPVIRQAGGRAGAR